MSNPYVVAGSGDAWSAEAAAAGRRGTQRLLDVSVISPDDEIRAALGVPDDQQVVCRSRLMLLDDVPVEIADSFYPGDFAIGSPLASRGKIRGGAVTALAEVGHAAAEVVETVTARLPDKSEMDLLAIASGEPLIVLSRISYDARGRAVEYAVNRMIASRTTPLVYRMRVVR
jgi:DNA-binding GntR family transcriptional regulator